MLPARQMAGALALSAAVLIASHQVAMACKSAGSFFDYRNCATGQTVMQAESAVPEGEQEIAAPAPPAPSSREAPVAVFKAPGRKQRGDRDRTRPQLPPAPEASTRQATNPAPAARGGTRLVDISDGAGRKITLGCVRGEAVVYFEFAEPMSDKGSRKEVYFTLDGGEPQILELERARKHSVLGVWQPWRAAPIIRKVLAARNAAVEATAADGSELLLSFRLGMDRTERSLLQRSCAI